MDPAQTSQMVSWLDEELRREKAQVSDLRDLLQKQAIELGDQRKRYEDLQVRLTRLQNDVARMTQVDQAIQQLKEELASVLQGVREELRRNDQQALQARQLEREAEAKSHLELSQRVERLLTLEDKVTVLSAEEGRLNDLMTTHRQRLDNIDKDLIRRSDQDHLIEDDHKRELGRMDAIQHALDGMRTQMESYAARFQYLERWAQGSAQRTAENQAFRVDMQRVQSELLEGQRRSEQRVERQIREWSTITESIHRDQEVWANQLRIFAEQHERTKKALASLQDMAKELRVAQDEARQALELGTEKQRRELREWQGENEKRWTRYLAQWEYRWNEQRKADEALTARVEDLEAHKKPVEQDLQALRTALAEEQAATRGAALDMWRYQMEYLQRQLDIMKATTEKVHAHLSQLEPPRGSGAKNA
jgi:chromosome segregation ATPase